MLEDIVSPPPRGLLYLSAIDPAAATTHLDGNHLCVVCRVAVRTSAVDAGGARRGIELVVEDLCLTDAAPDTRLATGVDLPIEVAACIDVANEVCRVELAESALDIVVVHVFTVPYPLIVLHEKELL